MTSPINQPSSAAMLGSPVVATSAAAVDKRLRRSGQSAVDKTHVAHSAKVGPKTVSLDTLQYQLQSLLAETSSYGQLVQSLVEIMAKLTNPVWCGHFAQNRQSQIVCTAEQNPIAEQNLGIHQSSLLPTVSMALANGSAKVSHNNELTVIANPVFVADQNELVANECLCVALNLGGVAVEPFLLICQLVSTTLSQWHAGSKTGDLDWQVDSVTAMAELMSKVVNAEGTRAAAIVATNELATFLNAPLVAIGYTQNENSKRNRVQSISGTTQIDPGGKQTRLIQSALNEALIRESVTSYPTIGGDDRSLKLAHQQLLEKYPASRIVSSPLTTNEGKTIGAWISVLPDDQQQQEHLTRFATVTSSYLADALHANQQASSGAVTRLGSQVSRFFGGKIGRMMMAVCLAFTLVMMIPVSHRIACDCELKPTVRRFAVAPHDGILLESFVEPGDIVSAGQVIAKMDDRELKLQLAHLMAERETALKKRDVNRSARDAAATQIAELEIEQLDARIDLIEFKQNNLEIKSTIDGIVLQGELDDAQGAPVRTGDVLMEVAPLETLRLELNVPDSDIAYVKTVQKATAVLDGAPFETLTGSLNSIRPESEVHNNKNVFVSEVEVDNSERLLRPGMRGRAKIEAGWRSLGWVLFHRPVERIYKLFR